MSDSSARAARGFFRRPTGDRPDPTREPEGPVHDGVALDLLDDEDLISRTRDGSAEAFEVLWVRHADSGRRVAARFTRASDPEDLVQEAYLRIYSALSRGKGPDGAFRPYLYQAIRNIAISWAAKPQADSIDVLPERSDGTDMSETVLENTVTVKAFRKLPQRWQSILWYSEVEGMEPAEIAPLMGLKASAVSALAYRAREGLRREWLQAHVNAEDVPPECRWAADRMGDFNRGALRGAAKDRFTEHVSSCARCMVLVEEVDEVSRKLGLILVPLVVGIPWAVFASMTAAVAAAGVVAGATAGLGVVGATGAASGGAGVAAGSIAASASVAAAGAGAGAGGGASGGAAAAAAAWVGPAALVAVASVAVVAVAGVLVANGGWLGSDDPVGAASSSPTSVDPSSATGGDAPTDAAVDPTDQTEPSEIVTDVAPTVDPAPPESPVNLPQEDVVASTPTAPTDTTGGVAATPTPITPVAPTVPTSPATPPVEPTAPATPPVEPTEPPQPPVSPAPAIPVLTVGPANGSTLMVFPTLSGTADPNTEIIIESSTGVAFATTKSNEKGVWSATLNGPDSTSMTYSIRAVRDGQTSESTELTTYTFLRPTLTEPADGATIWLTAENIIIDENGVERAASIPVKLSGDNGLYLQVGIDGFDTESKHLMTGSTMSFVWKTPVLGFHTMSVRYVTVELDPETGREVITGSGPRLINAFTLAVAR